MSEGQNYKPILIFCVRPKSPKRPLGTPKLFILYINMGFVSDFSEYNKNVFIWKTSHACKLVQHCNFILNPWLGPL